MARENQAVFLFTFSLGERTFSARENAQNLRHRNASYADEIGIFYLLAKRAGHIKFSEIIRPPGTGTECGLVERTNAAFAAKSRYRTNIGELAPVIGRQPRDGSSHFFVSCVAITLVPGTHIL